MSTGGEVGYRLARLATASGDYDIYPNAPLASKTNFTMDLGLNVQQITRVSFLNVAFRNNGYNINSTGGGANNTFAINYKGAVTEFEIKAGFYTTATLMSAMQAAIQAELDDIGNFDTFTLAQDSTTQIVSATFYNGLSDGTFSIQDASGSSGSWEMLGFVVDPPLDYTYPPSTQTKYATYLPSLGGLTQVYLRSNALAPGLFFDVSGQTKNICMTVPVTVPFGVENVWECKVDKLCEITYPSPRNLQKIDFALVDKEGNLIDLHGSNLVVNFKLWTNYY
jgi:hypothetical protein